VIHGVRAFAPLLVAQGSGHVVNVASMAGLAVIPFNGVYNATKHAVVSITETLRAEFDHLQAGVGATVVCPGVVETRIRDSARNRPGPAPTRQSSSLRPPQVGGAQPAGLSSAAVAEQVLAAVEANQLYLATNPGSGASVVRRVERLRRETEAPLTAHR
jgi:short-subunit dehydrogenase